MSAKIFDIRNEFKKLADPARAKVLAKYFREDRFYGLTVSQTRVIARKYAPEMSFARIKYLLQIGKHEERLCALFMLIEKLEKDPKKVFDFYLASTKHVNNWDLVDSSAPYILGPAASRATLYRLSRSKNIWERRMAIVATHYRIRQGDFAPTLKIATILLKDKEDLIHKAVGWMLREVGKKDEKILKKFLATHASRMPRTMLRYAIEKFPQGIRRKYLDMV